MQNPYEIVHAVLDKFRGLPERLARITDKTPEWYRSHGREPKTSNPEMSGNVSPVTHYMRYCGLFEAVHPGAGRMLSNRVHGVLDAEFAERDALLSSPVDLELLVFQRECDEACDAILAAKARARVQQRKIESGRRVKAA